MAPWMYKLGVEVVGWKLMLWIVAVAATFVHVKAADWGPLSVPNGGDVYWHAGVLAESEATYKPGTAHDATGNTWGAVHANIWPERHAVHAMEDATVCTP